MKIGRYKATIVIGYCPPLKKKWGIFTFANGFTLRLNKVAWHFWKLGKFV